MANGYRNALVQQIKDAGQELINRAERTLQDHDFVSYSISKVKGP